MEETKSHKNRINSTTIDPANGLLYFVKVDSKESINRIKK